MSLSQTNPVTHMNAGTCGIFIAIGHLQINCPHENRVRSPPRKTLLCPVMAPKHTRSLEVSQRAASKKPKAPEKWE